TRRRWCVLKSCRPRCGLNRADPSPPKSADTDCPNNTEPSNHGDQAKRFTAIRVRGASVTFEPGARTAWHTHPLGQTLIVTAGCGWVQREGGPVEEIRLGDVV